RLHVGSRLETVRAMDTPLRRSRRLEGLKPESPENPTSVLRARRALVEFESNPEERREPGSPRSDREEADSELPKSKEEPTPGSPRHQLQPSPGDGLGPKKREGSSAQAPASKKPKKEEVPKIPKGKPKSGRVWKDRSKKRFSQMVQDKPLRTSWQQKMKDRQERKQTKDFARHLQEEKERRRQEKKQRRAENLKRRLENERKAEIVQVIRNPTKLKRAKKQQLRSIEKRDTLAQLQKQPPQRPAAKI
ncbi:hypothetical protein E2I00_018322, partial [Balaenoptera physalus]